MTLTGFHPLISEWFTERFGDPTLPQAQGWPEIAAGRDTLIAAPTGSGKTMAAFLVCIDRLWRDWLDGNLEDGVRVVYVSPLKALSNDIQRNLESPLSEIRDLAEACGHEPPPIRAAVRTGDTTNSERQRIIRRPPHILVTTPESLYLMLTAQRSREILKSVDTVIVDEIHALARDKRGSHLTLTLERLDALCERRTTRIGLSATQRPIERIGQFLVGNGRLSLRESSERRGDIETAKTDSTLADESATSVEVENNIEEKNATFAERTATKATMPVIVDTGHARDMSLYIEVPDSDLQAVCSNEQWEETYTRLAALIQEHRSTLVFVNTRRMAERVSHHLREKLGEDAVAGHHGSLAKETRLSVERRLKAGELKAIVATASLEMGIDIGYIDLVCQIGSPRSIATFLQRVGRSGHSVGALPQGRLFPLTRDELLECMALVGAARKGILDAIEIPESPIDILAQQIVAAVACEEWGEEELFELVRGAFPYRELRREQFDEVLEMLSAGVTPSSKRGIYLHRDRINSRVRAKKNAGITALTSGGAIPEKAEYRVVTEPDKTFVGSLDEDFAIESLAGDIFLLGNTSWQIQQIRGGEVVVRDAGGAPPNVPFWFGEGPGRTIELSREVSHLRQRLASFLKDSASSGNDRETTRDELDLSEYGVDWRGADQALAYVEAQSIATGLVPSDKQIVFERFFDESGGMQLVIHAPFGSRINRAWGLALRKRFCRSFDFELQAAATDNGVLLSLSPQHSFPVDALFKMLGPHNGRYLLEQALLAAPMFQVRWRWNITRAMAVLRTRGGKRVPPYLQRFQSDDLLASAFPETVGCLENHSGDVEIPDHPLVQQTMHDCLTEAMDVDSWLEVLSQVEAGDIELIARDTREPSPFAHELLNAQPYAFLDDAPLEERRTRAVSTRRGLDVDDLARLDQHAIDQVRLEAWPLVRNADELHDALLCLGALPVKHGSPLAIALPTDSWSEFFEELVAANRATSVRVAQREFWIAAESWPLVEAVFPDAVAEPAIKLPAELDQPVEESAGKQKLVSGWLEVCGPTTADDVANRFGLAERRVSAILEALEGTGVVLRGNFTPTEEKESSAETEWCDRRLLARIHRLTLAGLREQIKPVAPERYMQFLIDRHRLSMKKWQGTMGVRAAIQQLQGFELSAGAWESQILERRCSDYDPTWLDQLFMTGEVTWGRMCPPQSESNRRSAAVSKSMPISLALRQDLPTLLSPERKPAETNDSKALAVLEELQHRGALFFQDLVGHCELLPGYVEEALRQLAAKGLITSDAFAAVRSLVRTRKPSSRRRGRTQQSLPAPSGRWSLFPGVVQSTSREEHVERWCHQLLERYGVVFRDLLTRESAAPAWRELVVVYRRMEMRGEIRGGRFVADVGGEQFATEEIISQLRAKRDEQDWIVLNAADPLNLVGIVIKGPRIPAIQTNTIILKDGHCIAANQSGTVTFFREVDQPTTVEMERALQTGRRFSQSHIRDRWEGNLERFSESLDGVEQEATEKTE